MLNKEEHLLVCVTEECAEIAKEADKGLRFGLNDRDPTLPSTGTNCERMIIEANQLLGVMRCLVAEGIIPKDWQNEEVQSAKMRKIRMMMEYAFRKGKLEDLTV